MRQREKWARTPRIADFRHPTQTNGVIVGGDAQRQDGVLVTIP
jgi:hypothetical protein